MVPTRSCQQILRKFVVLGNLSDYNPHWSKEYKEKTGGTRRYLGREDMEHFRSLVHQCVSPPHNFSQVWWIYLRHERTGLKEGKYSSFSLFSSWPTEDQVDSTHFLKYTYSWYVCLFLSLWQYEAVTPSLSAVSWRLELSEHTGNTFNP